jgi:hypothetical protein
MVNKYLKMAVGAALLALAAGAGAQIRPTYSYPVESRGGVPLLGGPLYFTPYVGVAVGRDDNIFTTRTNKKASTLYVTSPGFKLDARRPGMVFQANYQAQVGRYAQSEDDNYFDQNARLQLDMAFGSRTFLRLGEDYIRSHEPRGSTDRAISQHPDRYYVSSPNATFAFGAPGAAGRVELYAADARRHYIDNREFTATGDRRNKEYGGAFYWRVMPKTYVLAEARRTDIEYKIASPFSATEDRYYAGVSWEATALTTGTLKVGRMRREFDSGLPSVNATSWEGNISWAPRTYSTFDLYTARQTNESTGLGNFILSSVHGVTWTHAWSSVLNTAVDFRYQKDAYQGFDRTDETKSLGLKVGYRFRPWLTLGGAYVYTRRDSNQGQFEYDKNLYMLTATGSL